MNVSALPDHGTRRTLLRPRTSFVGRRAERISVLRHLRDAPVVTLVGPGGCGKTRLAIELAEELGGAFPDGVSFVALSALADPTLVTQAVASAIGVREQAGRLLSDVLAEYVKARAMVLLLDGCEHAADASARAIDHLVRAGPRLRVLATSRQPLDVPGEIVVPVESLPVPDGSTTLECLLRVDAAKLFVDRALTVQGDFRLTPETADWVRRICRRLDGIPLALELAAAQTGLFAIDEIAAGLDDRFRCFGNSKPSDLPAPFTLRAALDWTCALLEEPARRLLQRLSVFADTFTFQAAQAICSGDGVDADTVVDLLAVLVRQALVVPAPGPTSSIRYRLLDTVRDYGAKALASGSDATPVATRHLHFYRDLAERAAPRLCGEEQLEWFNRLEAEHDNLRAALAWSRDHAPANADGIRLAGALWWFWYTRGYLSEGRRWLEHLTARAAGDTPGVAFALGAAACIAWHQRDYEGATRLAQQAEGIGRARNDARTLLLIYVARGKVARERGELEGTSEIIDRAQALAQQTGDTWTEALTLLGRGNVATLLGRQADALRWYAESLALFLGLGDRWGIAHNLRVIANNVMARGELERAGAHLRESIALFEMLGDRSAAAYALADLGRLALLQGKPDVAAARLIESLVELHDLQDRLGTAEGLETIARVQATIGNGVRAAHLLGAAAGMRDAIGHPLPASRRSAHEQLRALLREQIGPDAYEAAWASGRGLPPDDAVDVVLGWD